MTYDKIRAIGLVMMALTLFGLLLDKVISPYPLYLMVWFYSIELLGCVTGFSYRRMVANGFIFGNTWWMALLDLGLAAGMAYKGYYICAAIVASYVIASFVNHRFVCKQLLR